MHKLTDKQKEIKTLLSQVVNTFTGLNVYIDGYKDGSVTTHVYGNRYKIKALKDFLTINREYFPKDMSVVEIDRELLYIGIETKEDCTMLADEIYILLKLHTGGL